MGEKRREKLLEIAIKQAAQAKEEEENAVKKKGRKGDTQGLGTGGTGFAAAEKGNKKKPKNEAKSKMVLW